MTDVIELVIQQLKQTYGPETIVYDEQVQQGIQLPCFFVRTSSYNQQRRLNDNFRQSIFVFVVYHPLTEDKRTEMNSVVNQLYVDNRWKYLSNKYHIHNLKADHNDEVLTISFSIIWQGRYELEKGELIENVNTTAIVK